MSTWLNNGRAALFDALTNVCDNVDRHVMTEMREKHDEHHRLRAEIEALKSQATPLALLRQENENLKAEIQRLRAEKKQNSTGSRAVLGELSTNTGSANSRERNSPKKTSASDAAKAVKTHQPATSEIAKIRQKVDDLRDKLRDRNGIIDKWAKYADGQDKIIQKLRTELQTYRKVFDVANTAHKRRQASLTVENGAANLTASDNPSLVRINEQNRLPLLDALTKPPMTPLQKHELTAATILDHENDITADSGGESSVRGERVPEIELPPLQRFRTAKKSTVLDHEPSSDGPVFVSAKSVAKRKRDNEGLKGRRAQRIKSEHSSSPDRSGGGSPEASHGESIDFEEEVRVPTPRKRKSLLQDDFKTPVTDPDRTLIGRSAGWSAQETLGLSMSANRSCTLSPGYLDSSTPSSITSALCDTVQHLQRQQGAAHASERTRRKGHVPSLALGVMDLAEDGENGPAELQKSSVKGRLDALLNSRSVKTPVAIGHAKAVNDRISRAEQPSFPAQNMLQWHAGPDMTLGSMQAWQEVVRQEDPKSVQKNATKPISELAPRTPSILREDMPRGRATLGEEKLLRERPVETLRPEDFKPNPKYNDGVPFIYDEVVRGKDARAELSGCIDLNCCGKTFRQFAEAERKTVGPSLTTRAEDISLMEKYLGDQAWQLGTMSREEKEATWLLAKTWELANKHGRHRQRYSRMPTPPGFWKVDFPSTQERAEERKQAEKIREALTQVRYREAMRCGGAWLFRDEDPR
ncbi:DNA repair protein endonuclease SAE2/CtIP C-terminus-domain-containing protein [Coniella lustricola]|uniref:DNA repair protein endonuclease SAE2/CtIP C-terminus-domain-containing protein n=1 Tax=Coniella lustricola TaxID=2025994 RepID=A0A2T3AHA7_9PEZI|nr:DNA repair protein endonuclease SAE2/CtIP C-terminus-domain-containing protein [Coniella lustricola]